ncbi:MAG: hypothetical protein M3Y24_05605 [Acidobacteriota bacterium]|nr:hypothetical protein [Acidobacteriota bacterium]
MLNQYADDAALASEAALFAEKHQLGDRLLAFYNKAAADSPRNYRWPLLLARIHTALRQYSDAIAAYDKAAYVRPDRTDILIAKADLEVRTLRFADAMGTNKKLYELSYHDSRYLLEQATLSARLGNKSEALRQLHAAYVDAHPNEPSGYLPVMRQLNAWHMFEEADSVYKRVRPMLSQGSESAAEIVRLEAQALTSLHRPTDAMAAVTDAWRGVKGLNVQAPGYSTAVGVAAREYLTPDEKAKLAAQISAPGGLTAPFDRYELANAAGLLEIEADAFTKKLQAEPTYLWSGLQELQASRLAFEPLGHQLELIAKSAKDENLRQQILTGSLDAYRKAGDAAAQLRLSTSRASGRQLPLNPSSFAELYVVAGPDLPARLTALSKRNPKYADAVVHYLIANRPLGEALAGIQTRGGVLPALWTKSYTALAGLYFLSPEPAVPAAFDSVLGPRTVDAELASLHTNAAAALRGDVWFYYAARYGDYLSFRNQDPADLLPATLERAPAASNSYLTLGDTYRDLKQVGRALSLYADALQLSPDRADIHDHIAVLLIHSDQRQEATQHWREAFRLLADRVEQGPLSPDYWQTAQNVFTHINQARLTDELHPDAETMLRAYVKRNDGYNLRPFAEGMLAYAPDRTRALHWVLELARQTNTNSLASELENSKWLSLEQREPLYRFAVDRATTQLNNSAGEAANSAREQLTQAQINYVNYLLSAHRPQDAWRTLQTIQPPASRPAELVLKTAALSGHLEDELSRYRSQPNTAPPGDQVLAAAAALEHDHQEDATRLKEFEYERELDGPQPSAAAHFGLAEVRLAQKRNAEAETLIKTATVAVGAPFENLPEAVRLLAKSGMKVEATQYAEQWKTAEPWDSKAQFAYARLKSDTALLNTIRQSGANPYSVRTSAAKEMGALKQPANGTTELDLLTHSAISPPEAEQPFFIQARLYAAQAAPNLNDRVNLLKQAIALNPGLITERVALANAALRTQQFALGMAAFESYRTSENDAVPELNETRLLAAEMLVARKRYSQAVALYNRVLAATSDAATRAPIEELRRKARTQSTLASLNAARQPVITEELTQPVVVKPKLTSLPAQRSFE